MRTVDIDLTKLMAVAQRGVVRSHLFMGFGLNAAHREDFADYTLDKLQGFIGPPIHLGPPNPSPTVVAEWKKEFAVWIIACSLTELINAYAAFLDALFHFIHLLPTLSTQESVPAKTLQEFERKGIPDKFEMLRKQYKISPPFADELSELYRARNCLTHGLGFVSEQNANKVTGALKVRWIGADAYGHDESSDSLIALPYEDLVNLSRASSIKIVILKTPRERTFKIGEKIRLSNRDLSEICRFVGIECLPAMASAFVAYLKDHGIELKVAAAP